MSAIVRNIHRVMVVSGVLTLTVLYAAVAPDAALRSTFGEPLNGAATELVVRNWGALVGLIGAMLIYAANKPPLRPLVLVVAASSKAVFVVLVLSQGGRFLDDQAGIAVGIDLMWILIFGAYLFAARPGRVRRPVEMV